MEKEELKEEIKEVIKKDIEENGVVKNSDINKQTDEEVKKEEEEKPKIFLVTKYSNLDPELFLNENILDYKCISCGLIPSFEKANEIICCGYLICDKCLKFFQKEKKSCPNCNTEELKTRLIKKENKIFYKTFKNLLIKCPYKCDWTGIWVDLESHLIECKLGYRECKYKKIGCKFLDESIKVIEHEKSEDKYHLDLALKFIKDNKIEKKKIRFEMGEICMTTCHPHGMKFMRSLAWTCDGAHLEQGCEYGKKIFRSDEARFRCSQCDFDLCDKCIVRYVM